MNTLILEATQDVVDLRRRIQEVAAARYAGAAVIAGEAEAVAVAEPVLGEIAGSLPFKALVAAPDHRSMIFDHIAKSSAVAFLPHGERYAEPMWSRVRRHSRSFMPWPVEKPFPEHSCSEPDSSINGWLMSADLAPSALSTLPIARWRLSELWPVLEATHQSVRWLSSPNAAPELHPPGPARALGPPTRTSRVLAVIPHFACEPWLAAAISSIVQQTRPPDGIVVIDDGSAEPPADICRQFPEVTLLQGRENVGPYRLIQQVVDETGYDLIMFQDADDWSCVDRLALILSEAERTGADWVGTQEIRVSETGVFAPSTYPLDVNRASENGPQHPLLNSTSVVSTGLVRRLGGLATGLRFSNDTELLYRAVFDARIVNIPDFSFLRRKRPNSMINNPETGMQSRKRQDLWKLLHERADHNVALRRAGKPLDLAPLSKAPSVPLTHICGPRLRGSAG